MPEEKNLEFTVEQSIVQMFFYQITKIADALKNISLIMEDSYQSRKVAQLNAEIISLKGKIKEQNKLIRKMRLEIKTLRYRD